MKWIVDESMKYLASEGGDAGWNLAVEVGADDKPTGRELHVTAPTPDMALDAAKVLAAHFSTANAAVHGRPAAAGKDDGREAT